ncbi:hypothetical protein N0P26_001246 [Acinetobacter baumannii]|uniref:Uncharacterized protein n=1 Tax=Acinetobacter baumannii TaxID=470 RepID=A0A9P2P7X7_ACIBA|nr:hypothetical protein [Acinetobacter baumannii]HAM67570.1 hypothetical protein [Acinetobacter nosocomialis]EKT9270707.1 hypothetical protein [Acinetobacter baumannii]EKT9314909.1 hypothetical protein [Acinetobacter baumannii]EKU3367569.1 hypothetical protein [Acinetobacter baumannii]EKU4197196.1 hypothetical protein [Acinetobacter baumannii]
MKRVQHLTPILNIVFKGKIFFLSRVNGRELIWLKRCEEMLPELYWDYSLDFPFKAKSISKVKDRKHRRACYQSFAQYKKSFKPRPIPKLKILKDEWLALEKWIASMQEATKTAAKKFSDMTDAMSYAFRTVKNGYWCAWDPAKEV